MHVNEVLDRAQKCLDGGRCIYRLGAGGMKPEASYPWTSKRELDCSGFVAWCFGVSRKIDIPYYKTLNGGWFETTALYRDAKSPFGFVRVVDLDSEPAKIGDIVVSPDRGKSQGHVAIVSRVEGPFPREIVHCSSRNEKIRGTAIGVTPISGFGADGWIVGRIAWVES